MLLYARLPVLTCRSAAATFATDAAVTTSPTTPTADGAATSGTVGTAAADAAAAAAAAGLSAECAQLRCRRAPCPRNRRLGRHLHLPQRSHLPGGRDRWVSQAFVCQWRVPCLRRRHSRHVRTHQPGRRRRASHLRAALAVSSTTGESSSSFTVAATSAPSCPAGAANANLSATSATAAASSATVYRLLRDARRG